LNRDQLKQLEKQLWSAADNLRANSGLKANQYSTPILGLIFLRFADNIYRGHEAEINAEFEKLSGTRREKPISDIAIAKCGFYLPDEARYEYLLELPEKENIASRIKQAMVAIETHKPELEDTLPKDEYFELMPDNSSSLLKSLLKTFADIPADAEGDIFGQIYEYFLGNFALAEGQGGGEFFTPKSVVRVMVEIIEPHGGKVFDPACGSGGMFVHSVKFVETHREALKTSKSSKSAADDIYVYGQEKTAETVKLAKMNLAVNGLRGEIKQGNSYYDDLVDSYGKFDFVLANPPFNVDDVNLSRVTGDRRFSDHGIPQNKTKVKKGEEGKQTVPNANYLWINLFATSLNECGRAALVMANSASDARHSEAEIRKTLIEKNLIYGMLTLPSNMFYTVTLPATLWFFDKAKVDDRILFIDARNIFTQIDRAHREFSEEQIANIAIISHLRKGHREKFTKLVDGYFASGFDQLAQTDNRVEPIAKQVVEVLDSTPDIVAEAESAVSELLFAWKDLGKYRKAYDKYLVKHAEATTVDKHNKAQRTLRESLDPFFEALHADLKRLDRVVRQHQKHKADEAKAEGKRSGVDRDTKEIKRRLEVLHTEIKNAESFFSHILWLQERFPGAKYEDVTGLCKLAGQADLEEQDYSLNPGRYVGVVIEEDGKTEEEFIEGLSAMQEELESLNSEAETLASVIAGNVRQLTGDS
jgi:type I restriction enzyme M protein